MRALALILLLLSAAPTALAAGDVPTRDMPPWLITDAEGETRVQLYVFWTRTCPHCVNALRFIESIRQERPWIEVHAFELSADRAHVERFVGMARALGAEARSVPAFFLCGRMIEGFDRPEGVGRQLLGLATFCQQAGVAATADAADIAANSALAGAATPGSRGEAMTGQSRLQIPLLGSLDPGALSLPVFTLVIAGLDAFNPCAFFVLFFLLSLMVHARSRTRMLLVGGTFVLFSGLIYFLFMAAWLNLFLVIGGAAIVTSVAGVVAVLVGGLNVKDYFLFRQGPSLTIPEAAKPGLFARMRSLLAAERLGAMLVGTVVLALAANSYELLCTAGFPMVYTRALTLHELTPLAYYAYLALYNLIYVTPLLVIVLVFTFTLGAKKLSERQGRILKLLSVVMMLGLGAVMLAAPALLTHPWVGAFLLLLAVGTTVLVTRLDGRSRVPSGQG